MPEDRRSLADLRRYDEKQLEKRRAQQQQERFNRLESTDWGRIGETVGRLGHVLEPQLSNESINREDNMESALMQGFAISASMGFSDFGFVGWTYAMISMSVYDKERKRRNKEIRRRRREAWQNAISRHKQKVLSFKGKVKRQAKALSASKAAKLARAAGQEDLAIDAQVVAASGRGSVDYVSLKEAAAARNTLEAKLLHGESRIESKIRDLRKLESTLALEYSASDEDRQKRGDQYREYGVESAHYSSAREQAEALEENY